MARQIEDRISIKSKEEMAVDIIESENRALYRYATVKISNEKREAFPDDARKLDENKIISRRKVMLSKLIGKPINPILLEEESIKPLLEVHQSEKVENTINQIKSLTDEKYDAVGTITFTTDEHSDSKTSIKVSRKSLMLAGIRPEQVGWQKVRGNNNRDMKKEIAEADQGEQITEAELMPIKKKGFTEFIKSLVNKITGKGER